MQVIEQQHIQGEGTPLFPSTQEDEVRKLAIVSLTIHHFALLGGDLGVGIPRMLACWTQQVNGRLVPTF